MTTDAWTSGHTTSHTWGKAGAAARARAEELRADCPLPMRMATALFGIDTEERQWRLEARARDRVGHKLANLPDGWRVFHDVPIGADGDVDHLVVGPAGVFALDAVYATRPPVVEAHSVHLGRRVFELDDVRRTAHRVRTGLLVTTGWNLPVTPALVVAGAAPDVVVRPTTVVVLRAVGVRLWLARHPRRLLSTEQVDTIAAAVRYADAWEIELGPVAVPDHDASPVGPGHEHRPWRETDRRSPSAPWTPQGTQTAPDRAPAGLTLTAPASVGPAVAQADSAGVEVLLVDQAQVQALAGGPVRGAASDGNRHDVGRELVDQVQQRRGQVGPADAQRPTLRRPRAGPRPCSHGPTWRLPRPCQPGSPRSATTPPASGLLLSTPATSGGTRPVAVHRHARLPRTRTEISQRPTGPGPMG